MPSRSNFWSDSHEIKPRPQTGARGDAFSLIEVTIALGVIAFVLLSVLGLLSMGLKSNHASYQETRGSGLLTLLEADLRYTHESVTTSSLFGFPLPYVSNSSGRVVNPSIASGSVFTVGLDDSEQSVPLSSRPPFQATVVYTRVPSATQPVPIEARLIVSWPGTNTTNTSMLTRGMGGSLEALAAFPAP